MIDDRVITCPQCFGRVGVSSTERERALERERDKLRAALEDAIAYIEKHHPAAKDGDDFSVFGVLWGRLRKSVSGEGEK